MKILQVMAGGDHGGAETAFVDMCIAMRDAGMDIEVATRANEVRVPALEGAGIKVHTLPFGGPLDIFTPWKLGRIIKNFSPLIVQTWMSRAAQKTPNWKSTKTPQRYLVVSRLVTPGSTEPPEESRWLVAKSCGAADWNALLARIEAARQSISTGWNALVDRARD